MFLIPKPPSDIPKARYNFVNDDHRVTVYIVSSNIRDVAKLNGTSLGEMLMNNDDKLSIHDKAQLIAVDAFTLNALGIADSFAEMFSQGDKRCLEAEHSGIDPARRPSDYQALLLAFHDLRETVREKYFSNYTGNEAEFIINHVDPKHHLVGIVIPEGFIQLSVGGQLNTVEELLRHRTEVTLTITRGVLKACQQFLTKEEVAVLNPVGLYRKYLQLLTM